VLVCLLPIFNDLIVVMKALTKLIFEHENDTSHSLP
jgi:hypothetical protein